MHAERYVVDITTNGSGAATSYTPEVKGAILSISYVKDSVTSFTDGVDFAITLETTGQNVWSEDNVNATKTVYPVAAAAVPAGTASALTETRIVAAQDRVKIAITNGGAAKLGRFHVVVGG
jgi:hypothetical protein